MEENSKFLPLVLLSRLGSTFGTFLDVIVINTTLLAITHSAHWVGIGLAARLFAGLAISPWAGLWVDRYSRRTLLLIAEFSMALVTLVPLFFSTDLLPYSMIFLLICNGFFGVIGELSFKSELPELATKEQLARYSGLLSFGGNVAIGVAALVALMADSWHLTIREVFVIDSISYLISGSTLFLIRFPKKEKSKNQGTKTSYRDLPKLEEWKTLLFCLVILAVDGVASGSHNVGFPVFSTAWDSARPLFLLGIIQAMWASGNIIGHLTQKFDRVSKMTTEELKKRYIFFTWVMSLGMISIFQFSSITMIALSAIIAGIGDGSYQTYYFLYVQKLPNEVRGKVFALTGIIIRLTLGSGLLIFPYVQDIFGLPRSVILFHGSVIATGFFYLLSHKFSAKKIEQASL